MALFQALVIGLLALIITPGYFFYFDVIPKVLVLLVGTAVAILVWGAPAQLGRGRAYRLFSMLLLLNLLSLAGSTAFSVNPALSAFGTNWRRFGSVVQATILLFAWLIATHTAGRPERVRTVCRVIAVAGGLSAVYGIAQYFGWDPLLPAAAYHIGEGVWTIVRPPGTLGYVSYFATWLLFVTFLSMALRAMESSAWWRGVALGSASLATIAMLLTGTRAAILGLLAGIAFGLYRRVANWRRVGNPPAGASHESMAPSRLSWRIPAVAAVIVVGAAGFYFSPAGVQMRSRTRWFVEDTSGGNRPALWRDSLRMATAKLPRGYGPEVFTGAFPAFESKALAESYPDFLHESPHNIFLDALIAQGIPGFLILCGLCFVGLQSGSETAWISAALAAGIVSQLFTVFTMPTALIFYVTIALAVSLRSAPAESRQDWRVRLAVAPIVLGLLYLTARFAISDHALAQARRGVQAGDLPMAVVSYERYQRWNPPGTTSDLWFSRALLELAQKTPDFTLRYQAISQSGAAAVRATKTAEDPFNAWYNMATLYATQNDPVRTERSLRSAIAANPYWFKPHWALAQLLRLLHRTEDAEQEAVLAAELDAGKNPEVAATLSEIRAQLAQAPPAAHK